ncbi:MULTISPECIES: hypothetical protein [unclassified Bradyrhizobium]|nr:MULTISPECIES: hypothetical protein [unclassified Bradyrhizobium]MDI4237508.1 hypothetical protein [Bradyrhizobium sp. Arg237L]
MNETGATRMLSKTIDRWLEGLLLRRRRAWLGHSDIETDFAAAL